MCLSSPSAPSAPPPPPPMPQPIAKAQVANETRSARTSERKRMAAMRGRSSTIATGSMGLQDDARTARKTLLGQ